jgi:hypothetical protein
MEILERFVAIDNVCAWPNLTLLPDQSIVTVIFNQPIHGRWEGDVDCWASVDGGRLWERRGAVTAHEPGTVRMNVGTGLAGNGDLVALVSGWEDSPPRGVVRQGEFIKTLPLLNCRSRDQGRTWTTLGDVPYPPGVTSITAHGDVTRAPGGWLGVAGHTWDAVKRRAIGGSRDVLFLRSDDDGRTWGRSTVIGAGDHNETDVLALGDSRWLAVSRTWTDQHLELSSSTDDGATWTRRRPVTLPRQHPGHLLRLADRRILLVYGIRNPGLYGIGGRVSADEGETWGQPMLLVDLVGTTDGGYPSSVQLADGTIVTAYYSNGIPTHRRYHMGVVRWRLDAP